MADDYAGYFSNLEQQYGLPSGYLTGAAGIETHGGQTPDRAGSQYQGMFQLGSGVRSTYGITDPQNWQQNATGAAKYAADNMKQLTQSLGRPPTADELYLAHQQGAGGAASLIKAGTSPAGFAVQSDNVSNNGGDPSAPASAFVGMWRDKFNKAMQRGAAPGMNSYSPIGPNVAAAPATPPATASGMLAAAPDWVQNALKSPGAPQAAQQIATAVDPKAQQAAPQMPQQPNLVQMGNQLSDQRQAFIRQRAQELMAALTSKRA